MAMKYLVETSAVSLNKYGEELCGDQSLLITARDHVTAVLSDGLGSGVKANILATLTSKIAATMLENGAKLDEVIDTVGRTLPVCRIRKIAYSTFTIIQVFQDGSTYLAEFDNPAVFYLHDHKLWHIPRRERTVNGRTISEAHFQMREGDYLIAVSDGVVHAGVGAALNFGWRWPNIAGFLERQSLSQPNANELARRLLQTCSDLYAGKPGDDATVVTLKVRLPRFATVAVGPPVNPADDSRYTQVLMDGPGKKVVCGGTTASLVARELRRDLTVDLNSVSSDIPPMGHIPGLELVTEGVITVSRALAYVKEDRDNWKGRFDGAARLAAILLDADEVVFLVGGAINPAHQNPDLPYNVTLKQQVIKELALYLQTLGKRVVTHHF